MLDVRAEAQNNALYSFRLHAFITGVLMGLMVRQWRSAFAMWHISSQQVLFTTSSNCKQSRSTSNTYTCSRIQILFWSGGKNDIRYFHPTWTFSVLCLISFCVVWALRFRLNIELNTVDTKIWDIFFRTDLVCYFHPTWTFSVLYLFKWDLYFYPI